MSRPAEGPARHEWLRQISLTGQGPQEEQWTFRRPGAQDVLAVRVSSGKSVDIKALKRQSSFLAEARRGEELRHAFPDKSRFLAIQSCPVCRAPVSDAVKDARIWDTDYFRCLGCGHAYADRCPPDEDLERFYAQHGADGNYYIRDEEIELRLKEIYLPKLEWAVAAYKANFGREPRSLLEMGSGAGHFLHCASRKCHAVAGVECDTVTSTWCRERFGIEVAASADELPETTFDMVCSFNVIEHTTDPAHFARLQRRYMGPESLLVLETPKYNSLTTAVQKVFSTVVRTHIAPFKHNHLFSDASLATLLFNNGLRVTDVWYFGQDMTEVLFQAFHAQGLEVDMDTVNAFMGAPQAALDAAGACDLILMAAKNAPPTPGA